MKRNSCELLPHIREDLFGLTRESGQFFPWTIKKFNIENSWKNSKGENVVIAIIDTGCDLDHEDLVPNLVEGYNVLDTNEKPLDDNGHGTHIAGTIAGSDNDRGIVGIAPKAKIMPIKALDDKGRGNNIKVAEAILWASDNGADFIAMSIGSRSPCVQIEKAVEYASKKNIIIFCAAGNFGIEAGIQYPAKYSNTIAIGAVDENLHICKFSCCGDELDFLAPGQNIISSVPGNKYATMSGTSMANPFAVGCAALLLSYARKPGMESMNNMLKSCDDYVSVFARKSLKLEQAEYAGKRRYEGCGIIKPIM